jgi:6-phosphogluconolactonase
MQIYVLEDERSAAVYGAKRIGEAARNAVLERGSCSLALSGGSTPSQKLSVLAGEDIPWAKVHIFQVDERAVPINSPQRNFANLRSILLSRVAAPEENIHPMPVDTDDLDAGARAYERELTTVLGSPPILDLVHLGLGADGHTASLVPGDADLARTSADVTVSGPYQGSRRMTLTYPILNRARAILWFVLGQDKAEMLQRLIKGDTSIPAGRIERSRAILVADKAAARR